MEFVWVGNYVTTHIFVNWAEKKKNELIEETIENPPEMIIAALRACLVEHMSVEKRCTTTLIHLDPGKVLVMKRVIGVH